MFLHRHSCHLDRRLHCHIFPKHNLLRSWQSQTKARQVLSSVFSLVCFLVICTVHYARHEILFCSVCERNCRGGGTTTEEEKSLTSGNDIVFSKSREGLCRIVISLPGCYTAAWLLIAIALPCIAHCIPTPNLIHTITPGRTRRRCAIVIVLRHVRDGECNWPRVGHKHVAFCRNVIAFCC